MKRAKKVILHIGTLKTGSTSLQIHLHNNSDELSKQGIGYYAQRFIPYKTWANAGFLCGRSIYDARGRKGAANRHKQEIDSFVEFAKNYDTLILSDEFMWEKGIEVPKFWDAVRSNIYRMLGEDTQIDIIVFLRRQDEWILSRWKEQLLKWYQIEIADFPDYLRHMEEMGHMDYAAALNSVVKMFGRDHVTVCGYRSDKDEGPDTTKSFIDATGIKLDPLKKTDKIFRNPSISMRTARAMLEINRRDDHKDESSRKKVVSAARLFSLMYPEENEYYPVDAKYRREFLERLKEINSLVSLEYNQGHDLFKKNIPDCPRWNNDPEQSAKDVDQILKLASTSDGAMRLLMGQLRS